MEASDSPAPSAQPLPIEPTAQAAASASAAAATPLQGISAAKSLKHLLVEREYKEAIKGWNIPGRLLIGYSLAFLFGMFYGLWCRAQGLSADKTPLVLVGTLFVAVPTIAALRETPPEKLRHIFFGTISNWRGVARVSLLAPTVSFALIFLASATARFLKIPYEEGSMEKVLETSLRHMPLLAIFFGVCIAPVYEEILMQGWLQTKFQKFGGTAAILLTTAVFTALHIGYGQVWVKSLALLMFGVIRQKTGSLLACIIGHSLQNLVAFGALWLYFNYAKH